MTYEEMDNARAVTSEKRIPKHGDENFRLGGTTGTGFPCEKRIPKHGDENTCNHMHKCRYGIFSEKRIPKHGDENPLSRTGYFFASSAMVKKESPNMGTKTPTQMTFLSPRR